MIATYYQAVAIRAGGSLHLRHVLEGIAVDVEETTPVERGNCLFRIRVWQPTCL